MKFKIFIIIIFLITTLFLNADNKSDSQIKYNSGLEKFNKGDIDGAIVDLREAINLDDRNFRAKKSLVDALLVKAKSLINEEKYDEATEIMKEAYRYFPTNQEVSELYKGLKDGTIQAARKAEKDRIEKERLEKEERERAEKERLEKEKLANLDKKDNQKTTATTIKKDTEKITTTTVIDNNSVSKKELAEIEKRYVLEMEKQRKMYEKIIEGYSKNSYAADPNFIKKQNEIFESFMEKYNQILTQNENDRKKSMELLIEQLKDNRKVIENQSRFSKNIILTIIISFLLLIILFISAFYILLFIAKKRKTVSDIANGSISNLSNISNLYFDTENLNKNNIIYDELNENKDMGVIESEMLKDLSKAEKLKKMHKEMKAGNLSWDTVKEYINEMEKELRIEILKIVENKLTNEEVNNIVSTLPILFPFLTDGDDYIREKSKNIIAKNISLDRLEFPDNNDIIEEIELTCPINIQNLSFRSQELDKVMYKPNHSLNVARYSKGIANILGLLKEDQYLIYETALIHDIGYAFIDKNILYSIKTKKELEQKEFDEIKKHAIKGEEMIKKCTDVKKEMLEGILYHHERNDGSGYPKGLKREEIPLFAKILGVADTFDALTSTRFHKNKLSFASALVVIKDMGKNKFNNEIIDALEIYIKKTNLINIG